MQEKSCEHSLRKCSLVRLREMSGENSPVVSLALGFPVTKPVKNALLLLNPPRP